MENGMTHISTVTIQWFLSADVFQIFFFLTFGCCSCCFIFVLLCRPGWQLLGSRYPPASAFQVAGITGTRHHAWLRYFFLQPELDSAKVSFCYLLPPCCELAVCHFYAGLYKCTVYS
jgi:hypothetical protein